MQKESTMHIREYGGLLAIPEKRALLWLAQHTPARINSDHFTLLGLVAMLLAGAGYYAAQWNRFALISVAVSLALNWLGDSLDGTLARVRGCQRPRYGYYVDHIIDLFGTAALLSGMALSGYMSHCVALALLAVYTMVEAETFLATHTQQIFRLSCFKIGPTELRIILAFGTLYLLHNPMVRIAGKGPYLLFDMGGIVAIAGLLSALIYSSIRNARSLYRAEPLISQG
jgi:archaetidylinositol phosphate synthase